MRLFLVSKKVAEFRKTSEKFWIKCITLYDRVVMSYLQGLASTYKLEQLDAYLHKYYSVRDVGFANTIENSNRFTTNLNLTQLSQNLVEGKTYLIVVGAEFKNSVFDFGDTHFKLRLG